MIITVLLGDSIVPVDKGGRVSLLGWTKKLYILLAPLNTVILGGSEDSCKSDCEFVDFRCE